MNEIISNFQKFINGITMYQLDQLSIVVFVVSFISILATIYSVYSDYRTEQSAFELKKKKKNQSNIVTDMFFKKLSKSLIAINLEKGRASDTYKKQVYIISFLLLGIFIFLISVGQLLFAFIVPPILLKAITKVMEMSLTNFDQHIQRCLPEAVDTMLRVFSSTPSVRAVLYNTSLVVEEPLKTYFNNMSIKMVNQSPEHVLEEAKEETRNIWLHNLIFTLIGYHTDASKEDVIKNLQDIKDVLRQEDRNKRKEQTERKMGILINYVLSGAAVVLFVLNIFFNPGAKEFFFSTLPGIACFVIGFTLIAASIFSNLLLASGKD